MKTFNKIEQEVIEWNRKFPIDRWWRQKHGVPFMSSVHRECSFLDQLFEYYEDRMVEEVRDKKDKYIPNQGEFLKIDSNNKQAVIESMEKQFEKEFLNGRQDG